MVKEEGIIEKIENAVEEIAEKVSEVTKNTEEKTTHKRFERKSDFRGRGRDRDDYKSKYEQKEFTKPVFVKKQTPFSDYKMFNKWSAKDVIISDLSLINYMNLDPVIIPHTFGKRTRGRFSKTQVNVVERLINKAMRSGQGKKKLSGKYIRGRGSCGKKLQIMNMVEDAFEIIEEKTKQNPIQVLVTAIENSAPREDVTRVKKGGVAYSIAVDVSPLKRLDAAIKNIALAGFGNSFNNKTDAASALAEEIISAANNDIKSIAIKRRDEVERIARASR